MPSLDSKSDYLKRLMIILDLSVLAFVYVISIKMYPLIRGGASIDESVHFGLLPILLVVFGIARSRLSRHLGIRRQTLRAQNIGILEQVALTVGAFALVAFLLKLETISRFTIITFGIGAAAALMLIRRFVIWWYMTRSSDSVDNRLQVLIVGSGRRARTLADQLQNSLEWGVNIVGYLDPVGESAGRRATDEILGHVDEISRVLRDNIVEDVIVAVPRSMLGDVQSIIDACQEEGVRLQFMADIYDFEVARIRLMQVDNIPLLSFEPVAREESALLAKRIFDLVVTLLAMPILLPFMLLVAIAIRVDSKGPAFFVQDRIGLHKHPFRMYKFRSMVPDADERMNEVEHLNEADGPNFKIENDPRITRLGRFIRKTSIDELPQLFNVILGDMSLVGPRPMSRRDVNLFDKGAQRKRFSVRPGITCLWQISGRSELSFDEWLELDLRYIDSWSFGLDLQILIRTIPAVLKRQGAV